LGLRLPVPPNCPLLNHAEIGGRDEVPGGGDLGALLRRAILAELKTLRAQEGQSNEFIDLRREELLGQYGRIAGILKRWEDKLRKKYEDFRKSLGI